MASTYEGDDLLFCPPEAYDFSQTFAVVVSGDFPNPCGHLILNLGGLGGYYFHVAGLYTYPKFMDEDGYRRYLKENGKRELRRYRVTIDQANAAMLMLEQQLAAKWLWGVLPHNCSSFVENIVQAGGSKAGLYFNCPRAEVFD